MPPATIALIIALVEEAIKVEPQVAAGLQSIFSKANPTPEDWQTLRANALAKSYADYVPASALPASSPAAQIPPVTTAATESNAPISQPGASETAQPAVAAAIPPYLDDGSKNPAHQG